MLNLDVHIEQWPIAGSFTISRGAKTQAVVLVVTLTDAAGLQGWGEAVPYAHYGETPDSVTSQLMKVRADIECAAHPRDLQALLPAGAARAAVDAALWDLYAKQTGHPVWTLAGLSAPHAQQTAYTLSLASPAQMAIAATAAQDYPLLKLKLGGNDDLACVDAVHNAAPTARLIADVNEGWTIDQLNHLAPQMAKLGVELLEQPLPRQQDADLSQYNGAIPLCADESFHDSADFSDLASAYGYINIKMEKTGGLTEALSCVKHAQSRNLGLMVGCMVATSLAMAPAFLLGGAADYLDLDGPLLLKTDRPQGFQYNKAMMSQAALPLWGE